MDAAPLPILLFVLASTALAVGLLVGPWLDIQQWHRAIQIHREGTSIRLAYASGAAIFFGVLLFHGIAALMLAPAAPGWMVRPNSEGFLHVKEFVAAYIYGPADTGRLLRASYLVFICLCIVSTLDSGYVSLKWYLRELTKKIEHVLVSMIPDAVMKSPPGPNLWAPPL